MKKRHMAAALVLPLVFKAPAEAQGPADGRSEFRIASGPSIGGTVDARSPYLPLGGVGSGVRIDSTPIIQQDRSEEHTSELQSLMRISYAVFCLKKKKKETQK